MPDRIEFEADFDNEDIDFDADAELEDALEERAASNGRTAELKARGREMFDSVKEKGRARVYEAAGRGKVRVAERLEEVGTRLDDRLAYGAEYLRTREIDDIGQDFIAQVRRRPLLSAGLALGAGYLVGKALHVPNPLNRKRKKRNAFGRQLSRAVMGSLASMVAARVAESLQSPRGEPEFEEYEEV